MTTAGWIFMVCSISFVVLLLAFCFKKVLSKPSTAGHLHAPLDIDTHDRGT